MIFDFATQGLEERNVRRVRVVNLGAFLGIVFSTLWLIVELLVNSISAIISAVTIALLLSVFVANALGRRRLGAHLLLAGVINVLGHSLFGLSAETGSNLWYIVFAMAPFIVLDVRRDRVGAALWSALSIAAFVTTQFRVFPTPFYDPSFKIDIPNTSTFNAATTVAALMAIVITFLSDIARAEREVKVLLRNMLPGPIAERLRAGETTIADRVDDVTVIFVDLVGFTPLASRLSADALVALLDEIFAAFDDITEHASLEKIKTIGDAYMAAEGLTGRSDVNAALSAALKMRAYVRECAERRQIDLRVRIGLHTGQVIAGVLGRSRRAYDLWGETVNLAARMESHAQPDEIQISDETRARLSEEFDVHKRRVDVKGYGPLETYVLLSET